MTDEARVHPPKFSEEKFRKVHIFVSGRVQRVFFRENTKKRAEGLGIVGWVKNLPDGRVEAVFEGEKSKVEELINRTKKGSLIARIDELKVILEEYKEEFDNFEIRCD